MDKEFDTCTCILGKSRKEIIIDGLRYGLIPIPAKRKEETLSDKVDDGIVPVYKEIYVREFIKQVKDKQEILKSLIDVLAYKLWNSKIGDTKAQELIDELHKGGREGIMVQADRAFETIENLAGDRF